MKILMSLILLSFSYFSNAEVSHYTVREGRFHKGGTAQIEVLAHSQKFIVKLKYEIYKKALAPIPSEYLKGEHVTELPEMFKDERGYLELEAKRQITIEEGTLTFLRRADYGIYKRAYVIQVRPSGSKSSSIITYHPSLPAAGWAQAEVIFSSKLPILNGYNLIIEKK